MGAMAVLWSLLGVLKHLFALPMFITIKKIIILHLFLGVPAATVGGTGTPWHTRGYAPGTHTQKAAYYSFIHVYLSLWHVNSSCPL